MSLRLGILGFSEGNGHPYSWSAIFNGYDPTVMADCPFPMIPEYLSRQSFPQDAIAEGQVTHVWTQDRTLSEHIAKASRIGHVVSDYREMLGQVDAVLLARDDAQTHYELSLPFLRAGLPVYIDKPIACDLKTLQAIYDNEQRQGQVFTCSAMRYAKEFQLSPDDRQALGRIHRIEARVPKSWPTYAIHIIEPVVVILGTDDRPLYFQRDRQGEQCVLEAEWSYGIHTRFTTLGPVSEPATITVHGEAGSQTLTFVDTFSAFRSALQAFVDTIKGRRAPDARTFIETTVRLVEAGL